MTSAQLAALKTEIETDPNVYGYAPLVAVGDDAGLAVMLNAPRAEIQIRRADVTGSEVFHAIAIADLATGLTAAQAQWFNALLSQPQIRLLNDDGSATPVRTNVIALVTGGSPSLSRLATLENRQGSRVEQLFGRGATVTHEDVGRALREEAA